MNFSVAVVVLIFASIVSSEDQIKSAEEQWKDFKVINSYLKKIITNQFFSWILSEITQKLKIRKDFCCSKTLSTK